MCSPRTPSTLLVNLLNRYLGASAGGQPVAPIRAGHALGHTLPGAAADVATDEFLSERAVL